MRMKPVVLIALAGAAFAQGPPPERGGRGRMGLGGPAGPGGPAIEYGAGFVRAGVKNAPFSAEVITESSHTLADGNHIRQILNLKVYRDSEGRTRREQMVSLNGLAPDATPQQMVFINDPVAGVTYSLNVKERTGVKYARTGGPQRLAQDGAGRGMGRRNAAGRNLKEELLGRQTVEGVPADGRRITITIPSGQAGNDLPLHIVVESWYSPDLQTTVLSKRSDPRSGDTVTRLVNINRSEPAHALFETPADYTLTESTARMPRPRGGPGR